MKKKTYQKPTTTVIELPQQSRLLLSSADQWLNYTPDMTPADDLKHLA